MPNAVFQTAEEIGQASLCLVSQFPEVSWGSGIPIVLDNGNMADYFYPYRLKAFIVAAARTGK